MPVTPKEGCRVEAQAFPVPLEGGEAKLAADAPFPVMAVPQHHPCIHPGGEAAVGVQPVEAAGQFSAAAAAHRSAAALRWVMSPPGRGEKGIPVFYLFGHAAHGHPGRYPSPP